MTWSCWFDFHSATITLYVLQGFHRIVNQSTSGLSKPRAYIVHCCILSCGMHLQQICSMGHCGYLLMTQHCCHAWLEHCAEWTTKAAERQQEQRAEKNKQNRAVHHNVRLQSKCEYFTRAFISCIRPQGNNYDLTTTTTTTDNRQQTTDNRQHHWAAYLSEIHCHCFISAAAKNINKWLVYKKCRV